MKTVFSITRQFSTEENNDPKIGDLIGLFFPVIADLGSASVEHINAEWESGYISSTNGDITADDLYQHTFVDVADYDYVLIPMYKNGSTTIYSGLCAGPGTSIAQRLTAAVGAGYSDNTAYYGCFPVSETNHYVAATISSSSYMPIIGIKTDQ